MLMPMVATMKVMEPSATTHGLPMRSTMATGSMIASPNTLTVPAVTITVMMANTMKLTGSPRKLPTFIVFARRETGEVTEIQQQCCEIGGDQHRRVRHVTHRGTFDPRTELQ